MTEPTPIVSEQDAKQGRRGNRVLVILAVSLVLALIAMGALLVWQDLAFRDDSTPRRPITPAPPSATEPRQNDPAAFTGPSERAPATPTPPASQPMQLAPERQGTAPMAPSSPSHQ